jgi:hypothetical protein
VGAWYALFGDSHLVFVLSHDPISGASGASVKWVVGKLDHEKLVAAGFTLKFIQNGTHLFAT